MSDLKHLVVHSLGAIYGCNQFHRRAPIDGPPLYSHEIHAFVSVVVAKLIPFKPSPAILFVQISRVAVKIAQSAKAKHQFGAVFNLSERLRRKPIYLRYAKNQLDASPSADLRKPQNFVMAFAFLPREAS
ncbi:hypothetical protein [Bradyrhizobium sp. TM233]|uniref:hypothetical protein n=1 Tax=Bradyrhizobium sp. TM233 TaxID=2599801 RepID=UPI0030C716FC